MTAAMALSTILVASALLVGLAPNSYAQGVLGTKHVEKAVDESTLIGSVELVMRAMMRGTDGEVTVSILQNGNEVDSASIDARGVLTSSYTEYPVDFDPVLSVTGAFDIVVEHQGNGRILLVTGDSFAISSETSTAGGGDDDAGAGDDDGTGGSDDNSGNDNTGEESDAELAEILANKVAEKQVDDDAEIEAIEFIARMMVRGTNGDLIVAIVKDNELLAAVELGVDGLTRSTYTDMTATFDDPVVVAGSFDIILAHIGDGRVLGNDLTIVGTTTPSEESPPDNPPPPPPPAPPAPSGSITAFAHRIPDSNWGDTFTGANAQMWFVLYNSTGWMVHSGFYDENGSTVSGLNEGATYYIYASDCDECHEAPHDVVFDHWEDSSTANPRTVTTGISAHAYYAFNPDP